MPVWATIVSVAHFPLGDHLIDATVKRGDGALQVPSAGCTSRA
jgi:hypothetical protein